MSEEKKYDPSPLPAVHINCLGYGCFLTLLGIAAIVLAVRWVFH